MPFPALPLATFLAVAIPLAPATAAQLTVTVTGPGLSGGEVGCALHASPDSFPLGQAGAGIVWVRPAAGRATCVFDAPPAGRYAIAVVHDVNGNRKTDTNLLGRPTEGWGVSANIRPALRAPRYDEAAFTIGTDDLTLAIDVAR